MLQAIYLPKLNNLVPTMDSTLLKLMEEAGELARAVLQFLPYDQTFADQPEAVGKAPAARRDEDCNGSVMGITLSSEPQEQQRRWGLYNSLLREVAGELLDVAQTCVTMIFVLEESHGIHIERLIDSHLQKLLEKGYHFDTAGTYSITTVENFKYMNLPRLTINVTLLTTVCKIQEELGELTQYLGKRAGASGEKADLERQEVLLACAAELLDVAQCCFTMMYILAEEYDVDIQAVAAEHVDKLRRKGYCL